MKTIYTFSLAFIFYLLAINSNVAAQTTYYVTVSGGGNGITPGTPMTLQEALSNSSLVAGDTIKVAAGTYLPTVDPSGGSDLRDKTFYIDKSIALKGGYDVNFTTQNIAGNPTILSGDVDLSGEEDAYHVVVWSTTTGNGLMEGFTVTGGKGHDGNGSIITIGGQNINRCYGGGIIIHQGSLTLERNTLTGNSSGGGGGGGVDNAGTLTMFQNTLTGNSCGNGSGGGVFNIGMLTMYQNTLTGNSTGNYSSSSGGGVYNAGMLTMYQNTLTGNSGVNGGGVDNTWKMSYGGNIITGNKAMGGNDMSFNYDPGRFHTSLGYNLIGENGTAGGITLLGSDQEITLADLSTVLPGTVSSGMFVPILTNGSYVMPLESGRDKLCKVPDTYLGTWVVTTNNAGQYVDQRNEAITTLGGVYYIGSVNIQSFAITSSAGSNGTITPSGSTPVVHGGSIAYSITPDADYRLDSLLVDEVNIPDSIAGGSYTFNNVITGHAIRAVFACPPVSITTQPIGNVVCPGSHQKFTVTATGIDSTFQWQKLNASNVWEDLTGGTAQTDSLVFNTVSVADVGSYRAVVSGICSKDTSDVATLTLNIPVSITSQPRSKVICEGETHTFRFQASGSIADYRWYRKGEFHPVSYGYTLQTGEAGTYYVKVFGTCNTIQSNEVTLTVYRSATIITQPVDASISEGSDYVIGLVASGDNLSYQWYYENEAIIGANGATYEIRGADIEHHSGRYKVQVKGICGPAVMSEESRIQVDDPTGIDPTAASQIKAYPNPVENILTIEGTQHQKQGIRIMDITGRTVYAGDAAEGSTTINLSGWSKGTYILYYNGVVAKVVKK